MKRSKTNAGLAVEAEKIDAFPFEQLPTDLIYKIFMDSGFTVNELHKLCSVSKKLKIICNDRKVWEQVLYKNVLEYGTAMRNAERSGDLPELMDKIRQTEDLYLVWKRIQNYEPFVVLTAIKLWKKWSRTWNDMWFLHHNDVGEDQFDQNPMYIEKRKKNGKFRVGIEYESDAESKNDYEKVFAELFNRFGVTEETKTRIVHIWRRKEIITKTARIVQTDISSEPWILFFCFLLTNGWNMLLVITGETERVFDNTPLASCVTCGNASFDQLGKCSCPCEQIFCSVQCQSKLH